MKFGLRRWLQSPQSVKSVLVIAILAVFFSAAGLTFAASNLASEIRAGSAILVDYQTGQILFEKNAYRRMGIASLTKIMTLLLAVEMVEQKKIRLTDVVTISDYAASMDGTILEVKAGDKITVKDLLYSAALISANDSAVALAEYIAGSEPAFAGMMTARARDLGLKDTQFQDATGIRGSWDGSYSTAYDVAQLTRVALKYPLFARLVSTKQAKLAYQDVSLSNSNLLLGTFKGADGVKTGFTSEAGHAFVGSATREGRRLIAVVLDEDTRRDRWNDAEKLLNYGFEHFINVVVREGETVARSQVDNGRYAGVPLIAKRSVATLTHKDDDGLFEKVVMLTKTPQAPIKKGQSIGRLVVKKDGKVIGQTDLVAGQRVPRAGVLFKIWRWLYTLITG
ncbi:MAG: D-alanyl-D-alanine carboxypeptidase family protein [Syntrophothermus sp.]